MGNWKSKDPPLIRTEIKEGSAILIPVFTLTCVKVQLIGIPIMHTAKYKWLSLIGYKIKMGKLCRPYLAFYPSLDIYSNNIVAISLSHFHFPLSLSNVINSVFFLNEERKACFLPQIVLLCIISTYLVLFVHEVDCSR